MTNGPLRPFSAEEGVVKRIFLLVLLFQCLSLPVMAQDGTGAIAGTTQDQSGAVLPGVTVNLATPGIVGGNQVVVTDPRGAYQFTRLVPASYTVKAELPGFRSAIYENIAVTADATTRIDMKLAVGEVSETLTVSGEAPLLDTTTALQQTSLDHRVIEALPSRNDIWSLARTVPSVVMSDYNVGGSSSYNQSSATVHGAFQTGEGGFAVDGMEVGNGNSSASAGVYLDSMGFQEANYTAGNSPAESSRGGLVYSMVTRTGTNAWHGEYTSSGTNQNFISENITPAFLRDLYAAVPPLALAANPRLVPSAKTISMFNSSGYVSGPIVPDKLWFAVTGDYGTLRKYQLGSYKPDGTRFVDDYGRWSVSSKISWQISPSHQLHFYNLELQKDQYHRISGSDLNTFWQPNAANYQSPNLKYLYQTRWTGVLSPKLLAEVGMSFMTGPMINLPEPEVQKGDLAAFDRVTLVNSVARGYYDNEPQYRAVFRPSLSYVTGNHEFKFGYEYNRGHTHFLFYSMSNYPAGMRAVFANDAADSVNIYDTPTDYVQWTTDNGMYAQDKWRATRKLTINVGLRLQNTVGGEPGSCLPQTAFFDAQCFAAIKNVPNFTNVIPRSSVIYDIFGNGKTALKLGANRYLPALEASYVDRVNPMKLATDTRTWTDLNHDGVPQLNELGPSSGFGLGTTNRYSPNIKRPYANELSVELEQQFPGRLVASVGYFHRENLKAIGSRNLAVPTSSYIPLQVVEKSSGQAVTVYNQDPATRGKFDTLWTNEPAMNERFDGVDMTINKRMSNHWMVMGCMSIGRDHGDTYGTTDLNNPNFTFRDGVTPSSVPLMAKASGLYEFPYQIQLSGSFQHDTGFPESTTVSVGKDTVALTQVTQSVRISPFGTARLPSINLIDLSLRKIFKFGNNRSIEPILDVYNLANVDTIQNRVTQLGLSYGRVGSILGGRMLKFGLNVNF